MKSFTTLAALLAAAISFTASAAPARLEKQGNTQQLVVDGKPFLILGGEEPRLSVTTKLPLSGRLALLLPFATPTGYGLGKSGWVTGDFGATDEVPVERLCEWIDESYRAIAPKKMVAELDGVAAPAKPPKAVPKRKKK